MRFESYGRITAFYNSVCSSYKANVQVVWTTFMVLPVILFPFAFDFFFYLFASLHRTSTDNIFCVPSDVIPNTVRTRLVRIAAGLRLERLTLGSTPVKQPLYTGGSATAATPSQCCVAHRAHMSPAYPSWLTAFLEINQTTL